MTSPMTARAWPTRVAVAACMLLAMGTVVQISRAEGDYFRLAGTLTTHNRTILASSFYATSGNGRPYAWSKFTLYGSNGSAESSPYTSDTFNQKVKFGCYQSAYGGGGHVMRESGWSSNAGLDLVSTAECPSGYVNAYYPRTKLDPAAAYPYSVGSNCGWGVTGHDVAELVQQVTGPGDSLTNVNLNVTVSIRTPWKSVA